MQTLQALYDPEQLGSLEQHWVAMLPFQFEVAKLPAER